jgi:DNA-binding transcriptional MerR regulator
VSTSSPRAELSIGELAERTGVSRRMLRYYEAQGLLDADRGENGYRRYDAGAPLVVAQIRGLLAAGIGTQTIRDVLPCAHGPEPRLEPCPELRARLADELADIEARIAALRSYRATLRGLIDTDSA